MMAESSGLLVSAERNHYVDRDAALPCEPSGVAKAALALNLMLLIILIIAGCVYIWLHCTKKRKTLRYGCGTSSKTLTLPTISNTPTYHYSPATAADKITPVVATTTGLTCNHADDNGDDDNGEYDDDDDAYNKKKKNYKRHGWMKTEKPAAKASATMLATTTQREVPRDHGKRNILRV